jgi:regulator of protease activity HflC (stomatin/prohibitin superfamily)
VKKFLRVILASVFLLVLVACERVPVGYVGVKVNKYGSDAGVQNQVLGPGGPYFTGLNTDIYTFPTFTQNYVWTASEHEGKAQDESISFQSKEGTNINADFGITYHINPVNVPTVFQKYRMGLDEITDLYLHNMVRDALVEEAGAFTLDDISSNKATFMKKVNQNLISRAAAAGITVELLSTIGNFRYPQAIIDGMNLKMVAMQKTIQSENEVAQTRAEAQKRVVNSMADVTVAQNEAQAIELRGAALAKNPEVLTQMWIKKWDGKQPEYLSGSSSILPTFQINK